MPWTNYHSHTYYCDGGGKPIDYVHAAIEKGLVAYGFSTHGPVPFPSGWNIDHQDILKYVNEISNLKHTHKKQLDIYLGLEVDYIPYKMGPENRAITKHQLDYTIGSIHFVDELPDGTPWHIDGGHEDFLHGLQQIFKNNIKQAISRYYELIIEMLETEKPTILGHLDKIKMQNPYNKLYNENDAWYQSLIEKLIRTIKKTGVIVEINTRGYYKNNDLEFYPSNRIVKELAKNDIPVTLNSDSHVPDEITNGFRDAAIALHKLGVNTLYALINDRWDAYKFNQQGIIID
ncbi:MAG: histidinol-phosphatase HisJ family protein [Bacteroidetes bacterium]|jgi:histidinol-phosphatase (PHP family)|nr:histidinol-phosphatase HisJ family protein [Bacteroidota bacterium]